MYNWPASIPQQDCNEQFVIDVNLKNLNWQELYFKLYAEKANTWKRKEKNANANWAVSIPQQDCDEQFGSDVRFSCDATGKQLK